MCMQYIINVFLCLAVVLSIADACSAFFTVLCVCSSCKCLLSFFLEICRALKHLTAGGFLLCKPDNLLDLFVFINKVETHRSL